MTSKSRPHPKSFSSFLPTATILMVALLAIVPVALGQAGSPGGDTVSEELSLDLRQLKTHFKPIFEKFGQRSTTKICLLYTSDAADE